MASVAPSVVLAAETCRRLAAAQEGALGRRQALAGDVPRWFLARELRAGRWQRTGRQSVVSHNGPLDWRTRCWVALLELDPRAALDGVSALRWDGLALTDEEVVVITPKGSRRRPLPTGVQLHESRRFRAGDVVEVGIRRAQPAVATVHAGLWAATDKQATFLLTFAVQQGRVEPADLSDALTAVRRHARRPLLTRTVADLVGGSRTLGEIDLVRGLRARGLPEPDRQSVRTRPSGKQYLDADFDAYGITLELDGSQHDLPAHRLADTLRDLDLAVEGRTVLRVAMMAWWLDAESVLDALERVFLARGWRRAA